MPFYILLITLSGTAELNPGLVQTLSICHWNLNSTRANNFSKLNLLKTCVNVHKFDIIWSSETYIHSSVDDESLEISGYYLICSNYPSNKKPGGICVYYKNVSFLKVAGDHLLEKYITFDLIISNKLCSLFAFYRWPSQS